MHFESHMSSFSIGVMLLVTLFLCCSIDSLFTLIHFIIINIEYIEGISRFCSNKDFLWELCVYYIKCVINWHQFFSIITTTTTATIIITIIMVIEYDFLLFILFKNEWFSICMWLIWVREQQENHKIKQQNKIVRFETISIFALVDCHIFNYIFQFMSHLFFFRFLLCSVWIVR